VVVVHPVQSYLCAFLSSLACFVKSVIDELEKYSVLSYLSTARQRILTFIFCSILSHLDW
jgi:hypothetical protein